MNQISGWGKTEYSNNLSVSDLNELQKVLEAGKTIIPRGAGMAYGDVGLNDKGYHFSQKKGLIQLLSQSTVLVSADVTIHELLDFLSTKGQSLYVVPGSRFISVGGAIASDIHGKNHSSQGTFSNHLQSIKLTQNGVDHLTTYPGDELFNLTCGGMGLTGVILEARITTRTVSCFDFITEISSTKSIDETFKKLIDLSQKHEYTIAWIDLLSPSNFGRGLIYSSNKCNCNIINYTRPKRLIKIPRFKFNVLQKRTMRYFNFVRYHKLALAKKSNKQSQYEVYFPSDLLKNWNNLFGRGGLMEYQFSFPFDKIEHAIKLVYKISETVNSTLVAAKIFGSSNSFPLSFPSSGVVVGITFPWSKKYLANLCEWDNELLIIGARKYISKDQYSSQSILKKMYPGFEDLRQYRMKHNLQDKWQSNFSRRMNL